MTAYIISIGDAKSNEANHDIYKQKLKGVVQELKSLAEKFPNSIFKQPVQGKKTMKKIELTEELLKEGLKEDTVHVVCGSVNKTFFWANINTVEIS